MQKRLVFASNSNGEKDGVEAAVRMCVRQCEGPKWKGSVGFCWRDGGCL